MRLKIAGAGLMAIVTLTACSTPEGQNLLKTVGLDDVQTQGCALGGLGGAVAGGVIGSMVGDGNAGLGALIGGVLGTAAGCSVGDIIEERRAEAENESQFLDNQIALSDQKATQLEKDNADIRERLDVNAGVLRELESSKTPLDARKKRATAAYDVNSRTVAEYQKLSEQVAKEIEVQETILDGIKDQPAESKRANELSGQVARLKAENAELEEAIKSLSAQNDRIGAFR